MLGVEAYLFIKKGDSNQTTVKKFITETECTIGRRGATYQPDLSFTSLFISRQHAVIRQERDQYVLYDLNSKHGTEVNGQPLQNTPHLLQYGDRITLAKGEAEFIFFTLENELDVTREFIRPLVATKDQVAEQIEMTPVNTVVKGLTINVERREILLDGVRLYLSGKDIDLLMLMYERVNQAVSYDEMKVHVWPERTSTEVDGLPDVGRAEINALVYRLRKRLGEYGDKIITIPRYGYMLDL
ncbi:FHA domain-containing protein [Brevibacillus laterosporus]|uniref:FHA domain-containing protein n=1 Tax=Brevibacillus laterosporus TaxID=1465 RepID=A0A518V5L7_BRELA|nr:FHA domain-containing protein [Brevibacillus laterosporus]